MDDEATEQPRGLLGDVQALEQELHRTIEKVSTDFLSPATRADRDRCLLASLIGVALSIGKLKPDVSLGPIVINLELAWCLPLGVAFAILYYALNLYVLARNDKIRWDSLFAIASKHSNSVLYELQSFVTMEFCKAQELWNERRGKVDEADFAVIKDARNSVRAIVSFIEQASRPLIRVKKRTARVVYLAVYGPLVLAILAEALLVWSILEAVVRKS